MGELAETEPLLELPVPHPATSDTRVVAANALVSVEGNRYSVPPGPVGAEVTIRRRLGDRNLRVISAPITSWSTDRTISLWPIDIEGQKHVPGLWLGKGDEGARFELGVITELKNRSVIDVLVVWCEVVTSDSTRPNATGIAWMRGAVAVAPMGLGGAADA